MSGGQVGGEFITLSNQERFRSLCSDLKGFEAEVQKLAIGEQLSRLRQEAGLTQAQVAQRAKTTASAITLYENAVYDRYELRTLQRIVGACGGRLDIILEPGPKTHRAA